MASTLNVSALTDYIARNTDELLVKAALSAKSLDYMTQRLNVKHKEALNYLDSTVVLADGKACGFASAGTDVLSERYIEVMPVKVNKEWCAMDFITTYANHQLLVTAGRETLPFEEKLVESNLNRIADALETLIWQGNTTLKIDGLIKQAQTETAVIDVAQAKGATATAAIAATYAAIPDKAFLRGDVMIFVDPTRYREYITEQNATCCANREVIDAASADIVYVGDSRVRIVPTLGLAGKNVMVAASRENLIYGTDIEDSQSIFDLWYSKDADMWRFNVRFNAGTQIMYPDEVVLTTIATE